MNIWKKGIVLLILLVIGLFGCAPQAEFIKLQDDLSTATRKQNQLQQRIEVVEGYLKDRTTTSQKGQQDIHRIIADLGVKIDQLSTDIQIIQGKLEENNHRISELAQRLDDQAYKIKELSAKIAAAEAKPAGASEKAAAPAPQEKGKTGQNPSDVYNRAYQDYVNGNFDLAMTGFQAYLAAGALLQVDHPGLPLRGGYDGIFGTNVGAGHGVGTLLA